MRPDPDYLKQLLTAFLDAPAPTTDIQELADAGLSYTDPKFEFHLFQLHDQGFVTEELRDRYTFGGSTELYGCRYVHSIIDENSNRIEHLDGAIREYTDEMLLERMETDIASAGRHTQYTKYWRVDGAIPLSTLKTLVYHHFRDNPLAGEYLGADKEVSSLEAPAPTLNAIARTVPHAGRWERYSRCSFLSSL